MKKIVRIEGMMCPHCEAAVKKALEALPKVEGANASYEDGTAVVDFREELEDEVIRAAIEEEGYKVAGIE